MSNSHESLGGGEQFEGLEAALTVEEQCLRNLLDLASVDEDGKPQPCSELFVALHNQAAPDTLWTSLRPHVIDATNTSPHVIPEGADVAATVTVGFDSKEGGHERLHNIDFVRTDQGLKVFKKGWFMIGDERLPRYVQELSATQVAAMSSDAVKIAQTTVEITAERLKLGPLVTEADPDGIRKFHVGDILSVITGRLVSARGIEGVYDLLGYMTNDTPYTTQLGRFAEECKPHLHQQLDGVLGAFYEPPKEAMTSTVNMYKWLSKIGTELDDGPLLAVKPITEDDHVVMDSITELTLDHGAEFVTKKLVVLDDEDLDEK